MSAGGARRSPGAALWLGLSVLLLAAPAPAAPRRAPPPPPLTAPRSPELAALERDLSSVDPARLAAALAQLTTGGKRPAALVSLLERRLAEGMPAALALVAIDALGKQGSPTSGAVLELYARHRDPALRKAALGALSRAVGAPAEQTLRAALLDPSAEARAEAARALGSLQVRAAVGDLLAALDRGTREAGESFAALCREQECDAVALRTGLWPLALMAAAIGALLARPASDVSDAQKLALVARLRAVATAEASALLQQLSASFPPSGTSPVRGQPSTSAEGLTSGRGSKRSSETRARLIRSRRKCRIPCRLGS